jgi:hypothetical protein
MKECHTIRFGIKSNLKPAYNFRLPDFPQILLPAVNLNLKVYQIKNKRIRLGFGGYWFSTKGAKT